MIISDRITTRTPQEIFQHHAEALIGEDLVGIVEDYADDAVFITPDGVRRGKTRSARRSPSSSATCPAPSGRS